MKELTFQMELMLMCQINKKMHALSLLVFLDKNFSYGPYLCDRCSNIVQKCNKLKNIAIVHVKKVYTEFTFCI